MVLKELIQRKSHWFVEKIVFAYDDQESYLEAIMFELRLVIEQSRLKS